MTLYKKKKNVKQYTKPIGIQTGILEGFLNNSISFGFIIHVSNSMLFLERHNESGTIFTYVGTQNVATAEWVG